MAGLGVEPVADPVAEGRRIVEAAAAREVPLRALGGVAVAMTCPSSERPPLARSYADIDLATTKSAKDQVVALLESLGYTGDKEFNILHGHRRLYFWDERAQRQVDVFVEEANLCHRIELGRRLEAVPLTLSLADLTVLKLQVVETNEKDYLDLCAIFADHEFTSDDSGINLPYIVELTSANWGLWRTLGMVSEQTERFALGVPDFEAAETVAERLRRLRAELESSPKSRAWKLRARIGDRKRWYELPEEVE
ncbi:MAG TPA: nucleotidyltransferase family protein [Solirubrobacterales bacterium]|nr:nucleotidyltransferase family protein [Solirubrobacterales bacterium]